MRGKRGINVFMLSPHGRMSPFQQAQMYSLDEPNIHNIAIEGVFDDCQDIVKAVSADAAFKAQWKIGTVNSINWARVAAQVVYYFSAYFAVTKEKGELVDFAVPSGQLRQHPRRTRRARRSACRSAGSFSRPTRTTCSTNSSGPRRYRPAARRRDARDVEPVDGHLEGVELRALHIRRRRPRVRRR